MIGQRIALNFVVGAGFIASVLVVNLILTAIIGVQLANSIMDLGGVLQGNFMLTITAIISLGITGLLVYVWVMLRSRIAKILKVTVTTATKISSQHKIAYVLTFVGVGALWWIALFGFTEFASGLTDVDVTDLNTLISAIQTGNIMLLLIAVGGLVVLGLVVALLGRAFSPTQKVVEKVTFGK